MQSAVPGPTKGVILVAVAIMTLQAILHLVQAVRGSAAPGGKEGAS